MPCDCFVRLRLEVAVAATKPSPAPLPFQRYSLRGCTVDMPPSNCRRRRGHITFRRAIPCLYVHGPASHAPTSSVWLVAFDTSKEQLLWTRSWCERVLSLRGGPKNWHTFGIWVSYPIRCTIVAILIYLRIIVIKWRHYYVVFRLLM